MGKSAERRLSELLDGFDTAMLITNGLDGALNARPMAVADVSKESELFFVSSASSTKVKEVENDSDVTLIFQNKSTFVSLHGKAIVVQDLALVAKLWSEAWRVWFPEGKADPSIRLLKVSPLDAEYWDSSGVQGISYAFEAAKAYIKGTTPATSEKQHGKIAL